MGKIKTSSCCPWFAFGLLSYCSKISRKFYAYITGHSFLPPDRVFGLVEKEIRRMEIICHQLQYLDIIEKQSQVVKLGENNCQDFDWKSEKTTVVL